MASDVVEAGNSKTLICLDGLNWLAAFWNHNPDMEFITDPWEGLRNSDKNVAAFVHAARESHFDIVVVTNADTKSPQAGETWRRRREEEVRNEKRSVCLGADMFLAESFQSRGVRVVRPVGEDAIDVLAAIAVQAAAAVVVSRNRNFFYYDVPIHVSRGFSVRGGKLTLDLPTTRDTHPFPRRISLQVQPHLALHHEQKLWSVGHLTKYLPSLKDGLIKRGTSSSSDKRMGNLHVLARPLRAAVYAIHGEQLPALERIPEWSEELQEVVWTETRVDADPALIPVLETPQAVVEWLLEHDKMCTPALDDYLQLEPWRATDRIFNICTLAAELVAVSSRGEWTMHKCMASLVDEPPTSIEISRIAHRCVPSSPSGTSSGIEPAGDDFELESSPFGARFASKVYNAKDQAYLIQEQVGNANQLVQRPKLNLKPRSTGSRESDTTNDSAPRVRQSNIFGSGRPRELVLKERDQTSN